VPEQFGFFGPRSATGAAALLPDPPWHYSGDLLTIEYRVHPDRVRELLPSPLGLAAEDPGAVAFIWADWQSCAADKAQLLDPVLGQGRTARGGVDPDRDEPARPDRAGAMVPVAFRPVGPAGRLAEQRRPPAGVRVPGAGRIGVTAGAHRISL